MRAPSYLKMTGPHRGEPGDGLTITVQVELSTPRQVIAFAWDMASRASASWWHRPAVFVALVMWGAFRMLERPS